MPIPIIGGLAAKVGASLLLGRVKRAAAAIPWQLWIAITAIALIGIGSCVHSNKVEQLRTASFKAGVAAEKKAGNERLAKMRRAALKWKAVAEQRAARISQEIRDAHEKTLRDNSARADSLRLRGPGAARCGPDDHSGVPATAGGREQAGRGADASAAGVPAEDGLAAVSWGWLVSQAEQCDANRSEVLSWREFHRRQSGLGVSQPGLFGQ